MTDMKRRSRGKYARKRLNAIRREVDQAYADLATAKRSRAKDRLEKIYRAESVIGKLVKIAVERSCGQ